MKNFFRSVSFSRRASAKGFTLIELMAVITIIGLLLVLASPAWSKLVVKAQSLNCAGKLRSIGTAVQVVVQDNGGYYPNIEPDPGNPIYLPEDNAQTLAQVLAPYDIADSALKCPADVAGANYFAQKGTSYMWRPLVDGEPEGSPTIIFRRGLLIHPAPSRIRLVTDFDSVHNGRANAVFADGHVKVY